MQWHKLASLRSRSLLVGLLVVCLLFSSSPSQAQTPSSTFGCLDITDDHTGVTSRFDLATGTFHELSRELPDLDDKPRSPDKQHFSYINAQKQLIIGSPTDPVEQSIDLPSDWDITGIGNLLKYWSYWSPNSRFLALLNEHDMDELIIVPVDKTAPLHFKLPDLIDPEGTIMSRVNWSPDSRYIVIASGMNRIDSEYYTANLNLYGVSGETRDMVVQNAVGFIESRDMGANYLQNAFDWSVDGKSIFYEQFVPGSDQTFNAMVYQIDTQHIATLAKNILKQPIYSSDYKHALIQWNDQDGVINTGVLDVDTGRMHTLDKGPDVVNMAWLAGKALVFRRSTLLWANSDGTAAHQVDVAPNRFVHYYIYDNTVNWLPIAYHASTRGRWLVAIAKAVQRELGENDLAYSAGSTAWIINLTTGQTHIVEDLTIGGYGMSPDGQFALLHRDEIDGPGQLVLVSLADGQVHPVMTDPGGSLFSIWAPQNKLLALVTQSDITLVKNDGTLLKHYDVEIMRELDDIGMDDTQTRIFYSDLNIKWSDCR